MSNTLSCVYCGKALENAEAVVRDLRAERDRIRNAFNETNTRRYSLILENQKLRDENDRLKDRLDVCHENRRYHAEMARQLQDDRDFLCTELDRLKAENAQLKEYTETLKDGKRHLEHWLASAETERDRLKEAVSGILIFINSDREYIFGEAPETTLGRVTDELRAVIKQQEEGE